MNLRHRRFITAVIFVIVCAAGAVAQNKLLTIEDIFDPVSRVNFSGSVPNIRWLKDGKHYLLANDPSKKDLPRLQKVDAATGEATTFFNTAKMQTAFESLGGINSQDAHQLSNRGSYIMNPAETAVLINYSNDLFYYELNSDKATRLTNNPEEEVGETFSPDGRMVGFVRNNNMYVLDLASMRERRLTTDGSP